MSANGEAARKVTIIGAGVVGMACAVHLLRDGHKVCVVDKEAPGQGCSFGNAAILSASYCVPISVPGIAWQVPGWLLDPLGPLSVRWRDMLALTPWFLRFIAAGSPARSTASGISLRALHKDCVHDFQAFFGSIGAGHMVKPNGLLFVYESEKKFASSAADFEIIQRHGARLEFLDAGQVQEMAPGISKGCVRGVFRPDDGQVTSPLGIVETMAAEFSRLGGTLLRREVRDIEMGADGPTRLICDGDNLDLDVLIVAAGALSAKFSKRLGSPVPLVGERGYHVTLPDPGISVPQSVMSAENKFAMTSLEIGLRAAGTTEFTGLEAPPNYKRAGVLLKHLKRLFPSANTEGYSEWMGMRPSLPDSLPVISASPHFGNAFFAFGHSHAGLMGSVITGQTISDLVGGRTPALDPKPFRVDRF
ncbi:MAG: FAD-dependent oxidoreductase [Rhodospirillales bacterium]|nr:FAD-dependent oxidoreductase [Rhodospirillales bacterium]